MSLYKQSGALIWRCLVRNTPRLNTTESRKIKRWVAPTLRELQRRKNIADPVPEQPRSSYLEWNYDSELFSFGKRLSEDFDKKLLQQALTHKSYANLVEMKPSEGGTPKGKPDDNYEMIKKGDEIISNYIKGYYGQKYPEEVVNVIHNHLTNVDMLAHVGLHIGLKDITLTSEFPIEKETLADTFKAVVCALKDSKGLERSQLFVKDILLCQLHDKDIDDIWTPDNPYEYLEKLSKQKGIKQLEPRLCNQSAINTILANYQVGIYSDKKLLGIGWGESVEVAKSTAALDAIYKIYNINKSFNCNSECK